MKKYQFNKIINGINYKFDLDLRPHVIFIGSLELVALIILIKIISKNWGVF
ncbi:hypothetical protein [Lactobacillus johnsonii]|uniref:hypothetical protein n=1 Tax=Lactobacillus johnsonii TaxID=33959 RepID=UPI0013C37595|nr:hypothetical protein [Lactobacillus johnsonii]